MGEKPKNGPRAGSWQEGLPASLLGQRIQERGLEVKSICS